MVKANETFYTIVDLHALTIPQDPYQLRTRTLATAASLLALGLDPKRCTLFIQSHVPEHTSLSWLLECTASMGELSRMIQFKEKGGKRESVKVGLFTYPVLQAADILLYQANQVPIGEDQLQHLELTRDIAKRFNHHYSKVFVVPEAVLPKHATRVMDLQYPNQKMSKSGNSSLGTVFILDEPSVIERKIKKAVTDAGSEVVYDPKKKPGVSNLLELLAASLPSGKAPTELAGDYPSYSTLKAATSEALIELLRPVRRSYTELISDQSELEAILKMGAVKARGVASATLSVAQQAMGLSV